MTLIEQIDEALREPDRLAHREWDQLLADCRDALVGSVSKENFEAFVRGVETGAAEQARDLATEKARADAAEARLAPALEALKASMWCSDGDLPLAEYVALLEKAGVL